MDRPHKLVLLGGSGVGKSNLALRFVKDQFTEHLESTIGAAFITQNVEQSDGTVVKFEIWDTAGQERYRSLAPMYYRGANSAIVVFDITSVTSFEKAKDYITEVKQQGSQGVTVVLTANKCDLAAERKVTEKDAKQYAEDHRLLYMETSAKTGQNVKELFQLLADSVDSSAVDTNPRFDLDNHAPPQDGTCPC